MKFQVHALGFVRDLIWVVSVGGSELAEAAPWFSFSGEMIKRGEYLVNNVGRCAECHTPRKANGELDNTKHLQGGPTWFTPNPGIKFKKWDKSAPDITQSGRASKWTEERLVTFFSTGVQANAPMPAYNMTVDDAKAVTAYLRSLPGKKKADAK